MSHLASQYLITIVHCNYRVLIITYLPIHVINYVPKRKINTEFLMQEQTNF